jgi:ATP-dependent DNA helicase RecQ
LAGARGVPPYLIFSDATLRELARIRPSELEKMHVIYGIGDSKLREFGTAFFNVLERHCGSRGLSRDNSFSCPRPPPERELRPSAAAAQAAILFRKGASLAEVARELDRAPGTVIEYLCEFILREKPASVARWVSDDVYHRVAEAAARVGVYPLKPLFVALNEQVPYDQLRIVTTHLRCKAQPAEG